MKKIILVLTTVVDDVINSFSLLLVSSETIETVMVMSVRSDVFGTVWYYIYSVYMCVYIYTKIYTVLHIQYMCLMYTYMYIYCIYSTVYYILYI